MRNENVPALTVCGSTASLNVAVTVEAMLTLVALFAGVKPLTVGGVESAGALVVKTTSTQ